MKHIALFVILFLYLLPAPLCLASAETAWTADDSTLVAFFPFNGNANDESGNANNPTFIGSGVTLTTDRFGNANKAYYFDGNTDSYIRIPADNFPTTDRTISFWFYADQMENHPTPISYGGDVCNNSVLMTFNKGGYPNAYTLLSHCGSNFISAPYSEAPVNNWYHFTLTISGATQKIFINGELQETANTFSTPTFVAGKSAILGALLFTDGNTVYVDPTAGYFQGKLDDFRFYNSAMTDLEVQNLYNFEVEGLVAYLPFNGNTIDVSGSGHDGTLYGNASLVPDRFNSPDRAYSFPDQTSNISLANSVNLNLEAGFTINAWIKYKSGRQRLIVDKHVCGTFNGFAFHIDWDGQIALYLANSGWSIVKTNDTFIEDRWYMVTAIYDAGTGIAKVYVDGELGGSGSVTYNNFNSYPISIGETYQNNCVAGNMDSAIDEVKIYNRALSDAEIETEYLISSNGLAAFFPFNANANDESGNMNNGINHNGIFARDRYGDDSASMYFDGVESYIEGENPGNNLPEGNSPRTFAAWVRNELYNPYGTNIFHYGTAEAAPSNMHLLITDVLGFGNGYGFGMVYGTMNLADTVWHHVAGVYEGGGERMAKLYIDGQLHASGQITSEPNTVLGTKWKIGRFMEGSTNFRGNIDELRVYNFALTDDDVEQLYRATTTAPTLLSPPNGSIVNTLTPLLDWDSTVTATTYELLFATDSTCINMLFNETVSSSDYQFSTGSLETDTMYYWKIRSINDGGIGPWSDVFHFNIIVSAVEEEGRYPKEMMLGQNYPNPFNPITSFQFSIANSQFTILKVYDVLGREVTSLVNERKEPGTYTVQWDAASQPSGIYFYRMQAGSFIETKKLLLIK
jgi:hypothetical protein